MISLAASPCRKIKRLSGAPDALLTSGDRGGRSGEGAYGHPADGGLLQEELKVAHFPGVWRRVRGFNQVRRRGHELHDTSDSVRFSRGATEMILHGQSTPFRLTSYEQLSPAPRQLSWICQAWICTTSLSETSGHEIPNSLRCRTRLRISYRHAQKMRNRLTKILPSGGL